MNYRIAGLPADRFQPLFKLNDAELVELGAKRYIANAKPGFPCRISLEDAEIGEELILIPYQHQAAATPYRAAGPIFVRRAAKSAYDRANEVPALLRHRLLSIRAYDASDLMIDAEVLPGVDFDPAAERFLGNPAVAYLHVHYARPGCFACRVDRI